MRCPRSLEVQPEEYLVDPGSSRWDAFREHFPGCPDCSEELAGWWELEELLRSAAGSTPRAHPEVARLLALQRSAEPLAPADRDRLSRHVERCRVCRDSLSALASFDFAAAAGGSARRPAGVANARAGSRLKPFLDSLLSERHAASLAGLLALLLAVPLAGAGLWWLADGQEAQRSSPAARTRAVASPEAPLPAAEQPEPVREIASAPEATQVPEATSPRPPRAAPSPAAAPSETSPPQRTREAPPREEVAGDAPAPDPGALLLAMASLGPPDYRAPDFFSGLGGARIQEISRSGSARLPELQALTPDHPGRSLDPSPTLYWFISEPTPLRLRFSLIDPEAIDPVLELALDAASQAGVRGIGLAEHGVRLEPGIRYRWFVSLSSDAQGGGADLLSGGAIERVEADEPLRSALADAPPAELGHRYAQQGLWYDAFEFFSEWVESRPADPTPRLQRAALLEQVGLGAAAASERRLAEGRAPRALD